MSTSSELDPALKQALNLLHSPNPQAAEEIRNCLDEIIKQRYGPAKMLINTISKKHLEEEPIAPGFVITIPDQSDEVISLLNSPTKTISDSPNTIGDSDDVGILTMAVNEEVENLKEFGDLKCVVCGEMMFTATNRLIECSKCGSLYHQECHKPSITDEEASEDHEATWQCINCCNKHIIIDEPITIQSKNLKSSVSSSSRSSSSSTSSSPFYRHEHSSSSSSKHHKGSSSSKSTHKDDSPMPSTSRTASSTSSSSKAMVTPCINVISAADKGSSHSLKKSSSHSSSSSGNKSSSSKSSSSKHHESGSGKRKSSK